MSSSRYKPDNAVDARTPSSIARSAGADDGWRERIGKALLRRIMTKLTSGRLQIVTPAGATLIHAAAGASANADDGPRGVLILHRWRALWRLIRRGDIGFAESYIDGDWSSPDVAALIALAATNRVALDRTLSGGRLSEAIERLKHRLRANTRHGSRRNIIAHYDLGNAFYAHWLDADMMYSSALYPCDIRHFPLHDRPGEIARPFVDDGIPTLEAAQARKLDAIIAQLDLKGGERILEIGCGWGQLAKRLAEAGANVVGITLSPAQHRAATARIAEAGWEDAVDIRLQDYRDIDGQFDRIVSIEMFEAVGEAYWPVYFERLSALLKPGGSILLQIITIAEHRFQSYRHDVDFIQRYVFPGGMLPAPSHIGQLAQTAGLALREVRRFGASYALTLAEWHRRFQDAWPAIRDQDPRFDARFRRLWEYYLKYCEGGFSAGAIDVGFYRLSPAEGRREA